MSGRLAKTLPSRCSLPGVARAARAAARARGGQRAAARARAGSCRLPGLASGHRIAAPDRPDRPVHVGFRLQERDARPAGRRRARVAAAGVTISRDAYGVPTIRADNDRRPLVRRGVRGRRGPAVPARAVPPRDAGPAGRDPRQVVPGGRLRRAPRLLHARPSSSDQFAALPAEFRARVEAYRDGVNAYIREVRDEPDASCPASSPPLGALRPPTGRSATR